MSESDPMRMDRREAMKWIASAAATISFLDAEAFGADATQVQGYGTDPNLLDPTLPWERTLSDPQRRTVAALCDVILPADDRSPAASEVGVHEFIDEWVSAPYPAQRADRDRILAGLKWLDQESRKRFGKPFVDLEQGQKTAICDDICYAPEAKAEHQEAAHFFTKMRNLTCGAFYTSQPGMDDIQYIGNVALSTFPGPPPDVLEHLGLK